jgi:hypothetical protein
MARSIAVAGIKTLTVVMARSIAVAEARKMTASKQMFMIKIISIQQKLSHYNRQFPNQ